MSINFSLKTRCTTALPALVCAWDVSEVLPHSLNCTFSFLRALFQSDITPQGFSGYFLTWFDCLIRASSPNKVCTCENKLERLQSLAVSLRLFPAYFVSNAPNNFWFLYESELVSSYKLEQSFFSLKFLLFFFFCFFFFFFFFCLCAPFFLKIVKTDVSEDRMVNFYSIEREAFRFFFYIKDNNNKYVFFTDFAVGFGAHACSDGGEFITFHWDIKGLLSYLLYKGAAQILGLDCLTCPITTYNVRLCFILKLVIFAWVNMSFNPCCHPWTLSVPPQYYSPPSILTYSSTSYHWVRETTFATVRTGFQSDKLNYFEYFDWANFVFYLFCVLMLKKAAMMLINCHELGSTFRLYPQYPALSCNAILASQPASGVYWFRK